MDYRLGLVCVPVSDVDAAKDFYVDRLGFVPDHDDQLQDGVRFVQLTPPGSGCSICIGEGLTTMTPGSLEGLQLVVADADAAHAELSARGAPVSDVEELPWGRFVYFSDPDGNAWNIQQPVSPSP
ncbi:Catechol 2,3-dioxygenase [Jatrophihabitans endophyticus]|uniref:Catechol 2,3-dioxygenase n=1 Tax=Jatrophihabitans endophyticus TaxID=1206085 RepID=A0A1M5D3A0_9ACTN|nr:glyoxalase superfamily protein [Jatrophihabitans endophyticus]SHF61479.1 Catechol 2,3-dioxygenase [Jatrophihabitans endophyticus]